MRIDIDSVLRQRAPRHYRYLPKALIRALARSICQDELNALLAANEGREGIPFARGVLGDLDVRYDIRGTLPDPARKRVVIVSNHPLGGLDGLVLACVAADIYGQESQPKFVVNDLLDWVEPLRPIFLGVNKHGAQSRAKAAAIDQAFAGDGPILMFPAGLVSRRQPDGSVADLKWHKMAVVRAIATHRDIIPVHFSGHNSGFFYNFAHLRARLGLRFNLEMIRLPREMVRSRGSHYTVTIGSPLPWQTLKGGLQAQAQAQSLRSQVYSLSVRDGN